MANRTWRFAPFLAWPLVAAIALAFRVPLAIDETRYLTVAWEMFLRGDWLLPHLNGVLYVHKPPLLFWLIGAGWKLFGVNDWWPRLVPLLASLVGMLATWRLARRLFPYAGDAPPLAAMLAGGTVVWAATSTMIMFDMLLAACVLTGLVGLAGAGAGDRRGWLIFGLGLGLGLLAKGPVALLHLLPPAALGPAWSDAARARRGHWYLGLSVAVVLGLAVAGCWVVPAVLSGGGAYARAILWTQTADRVAASFAHPRDWWWYLPLLPALALPWTLWKPGLRGLRHAVRTMEPGTRFCFAWALPVFVGFCLVSGKQPQYLLPVLPAVGLLMARGMATEQAMSYRPARALALLPLATLGLVVSAGIWPGWDYNGWLEDLKPVPVAAFWLVLAWAVLPFRVTLLEGAGRLSVASTLALSLCAVALLGSAAGRAYAVGPAAREVAGLQAQGITVAYLGDYHGQLGYVGRLRHPLPELTNLGDLDALARRDPGARVLIESRANPLRAAPRLPSAVIAYRSDFWSLWTALQLARDPGILEVIGARWKPEQGESME